MENRCTNPHLADLKPYSVFVHPKMSTTSTRLSLNFHQYISPSDPVQFTGKRMLVRHAHVYPHFQSVAYVQALQFLTRPTLTNLLCVFFLDTTIEAQIGAPSPITAPRTSTHHTIEPPSLTYARACRKVPLTKDDESQMKNHPPPRLCGYRTRTEVRLSDRHFSTPT